MRILVIFLALIINQISQAAALTGNTANESEQKSHSEIRSSLSSSECFEMEEQSFRSLADHTGWIYKGNSLCTRSVATLDEQELFIDMLKKAEPGQTISVLDYGAGECKSNDGYLVLLAKDENAQLILNKDLQVILVSVTGDKLSSDSRYEERLEGKIKSYKLDKFFIANLDEELKKIEGLEDLKFNLVHESWALRHLVNPLAALEIILSRTEENGIIAFKGFLSAIEGNDPAVFSGFNILEFIYYSGLPFLFYPDSCGRNVGDFLLQKTSIAEFPFVLERVISTKGARNQCGSEKVCNFKRLRKAGEFNGFCGRGYIYGSENSRDFYEQIKNFTNTYFICRRISEENRKPTEFREINFISN